MRHRVGWHLMRASTTGATFGKVKRSPGSSLRLGRTFGWERGRRFVGPWTSASPLGVIVDLPSSGPKEGVLLELRSRGYQVGSWRIRCTDYGDAVAKVKWIIVGVHGRPDVCGWKPPAVTAADPNGIDKVVRSCAHKGAWLDDEWEACLSRRISTSGEKMLPWPAGHF